MNSPVVLIDPVKFFLYLAAHNEMFCCIKRRRSNFVCKLKTINQYSWNVGIAMQLDLSLLTMLVAGIG